MGLIKAGIGALGGTLADQWKEFFYCEALPNDAWDATMNAIEEADIVLVIGTSLRVYPVNELPRMTRGKCVYMNMECEDDIAASYAFDAVLEGKAGDLLTRLHAE